MNKNAVVQIYSIPSGNHISDIIIFRKSGMGFPIEIHHTAIWDFTWNLVVFHRFSWLEADDRSQTAGNHSETLLIWFVITQNRFGIHTG